MDHQTSIQEALSEIAHEDLIDLAEEYPDRRRLTIDWQTLASDWDAIGLRSDDVDEDEADQEDGELRLEDVHGLASDVIERPSTMVDRFEEAAAEYDVPNRERPMSQINIGFENLPADAHFSVGEFSPASWESRLISLKGQITKRTEVNPRLDQGVFKCLHCGNVEHLNQPDYGEVRTPNECRNCERKTFWNLNEARSEFVDYQKIRLQQPPEEARGETENIDIHLTGDLAGDPRVEGGARTTFVGQLDPVWTGEVVFDKTILGNDFTVETGTSDPNLEEFQDVIDEIREHPNAFDELVANFAPDHEGNWYIKAALVLQLFGGWHRVGPHGGVHRGDSHIYLLGDPGTGKTLLLEAMYERAPRGALTDGTGSSSAGLTAAIVKDSFSDEQFSIEAGTLVRANEGIAIVDELDKGDTSDLDALHTALESQEVHVSKAGKNAMLPARTALLAAGNPTGGHFDPSMEFADQVDLQSPLLSRFDLIYCVRAKEDEAEVRGIAETMIEARDVAAAFAHDEEIDVDELATRISTEEFKAIVTAAQRLEPRPTDELKERMRDWYTELKTSLPERYGSAIDDQAEYDGPPLPITARKLDAMQRLCEASARIRFDDTVRMRDFERVKPLIERSLADIGIAPRDNSAFGTVDDDLDTSEVGLET